MAIRVMLSLAAQKLLHHQLYMNHVIHHHVLKMPSVLNEMVTQNVHAFLRILVIHTQLAVDPNVYTIQIVPVIKPALNNIAVIHALVFVVQMPNVQL